MNLLESIVTYLAQKTSMVGGTNAFYNSMPASPDICINVEEPKLSTPVNSQINAEIHFIKLSARGTTHNEAYDKACSMHRWLLSDEENIEGNFDNVDTPGFITLDANLEVHVDLHGKPILESIDQQGRKIYFFTATLITPRIF